MLQSCETEVSNNYLRKEVHLIHKEQSPFSISYFFNNFFRIFRPFATKCNHVVSGHNYTSITAKPFFVIRCKPANMFILYGRPKLELESPLIH